MKGSAKNTPSNHVEWANGFKSNMPDWITARHCAVSDTMLFWLKECRTILLALDRTPDGGGIVFNDPYLAEKFSRTLNSTMDVIAEADGMTDLREVLSAPKPFPKPPGM